MSEIQTWSKIVGELSVHPTTVFSCIVIGALVSFILLAPKNKILMFSRYLKKFIPLNGVFELLVDFSLNMTVAVIAAVALYNFSDMKGAFMAGMSVLPVLTSRSA